MNSQHRGGMTATGALRLEYTVIGLGILALFLIFQPFSIVLFSIGCILVVIAGLANNLLPLARPGVRVKSVVTIAMIVAMVFCIAILVSITAAHFYGVFFLKAPDPNSVTGRAMLSAKPFYTHPFVWSVAAVGVVLALLIRQLSRSR